MPHASSDMLRDARRNRAYAEAIARTVRRAADDIRAGTTTATATTVTTIPRPLGVLDIGTGSGLLGTLAANACAAAGIRATISAFEVATLLSSFQRRRARP